MFDERMLQFFAQLAEMHVDPSVSDLKRVDNVPDDARSEGENRPNWSKVDLETKWKWTGLFSDVGIFSDASWNFIMSKCISSMSGYIHIEGTFLGVLSAHVHSLQRFHSMMRAPCQLGRTPIISQLSK